MRMLCLGATIAPTLVVSLTAQAFDCPGTVVSPFAPTEAATHDHLKYASAIVGRDKAFFAYHAVFDDQNDENGDGIPDQLANPTFVAYEVKGMQPTSAEEFVEPDLSVGGNW
jgi:hypothetical protein